MKDVLKHTPIWTWAVMALALLFIGASVVMITTVTRCLDEIADGAGLIRRIKAVEGPVQSMDQVVLSEMRPDAAAGELSWSALETAFRRARAGLAQGGGDDDLSRALSLRLAEIAPDLEAQRAELVNGAVPGADPAEGYLRFRNTQLRAIEAVEETIAAVRSRLTERSLVLRTRWRDLVILVIISCLLTFILALTVMLHQRASRERHRAEKALRESERRFRTIFEAEPECVKLVGADGTLLDMNPAGLEMIEADSLEQVQGQSILPLVATEHREAFQETSARVIQGEARMLEFEIVGRRGTRRWMESHFVPLGDHEHAHPVLLAVTRDISERKRAEAESVRRGRLERLLYSELDHRVRNNLASLITLVTMTEQTTCEVPDFATSIRGRIQVMASVHEMLSKSRWSAVRLRDLVTKLLPEDGHQRVELAGPVVTIPPHQATAMAMVIHELITNSLKYGALATEAGRIELCWAPAEAGSCPGEDTVDLRWSWRERGGPMIEMKPVPGLGTDLIRGLTQSELRGSATLSYPREGVFHEFATTLDRETPKALRSS